MVYATPNPIVGVATATADGTRIATHNITGRYSLRNSGQFDFNLVAGRGLEART